MIVDEGAAGINYRAIEVESDSRFILIPNGYSVTIFEYSLLSHCYLAVFQFLANMFLRKANGRVHIKTF